MARAHRASDDAYNARRRYKRQAERMRRKAERSESSIESARLNAYSDVLEDYAARTYAGRSSEGSQNYLEAESFKQLSGAFDDETFGGIAELDLHLLFGQAFV